MKRVGHLFEKMIAFDNLLSASRRAMQGSGRTDPVCRFFFRLEPELLKLQKELAQGSYRPGAYRFFTVHDPKERTIAVAPFRDRVVHHAVVGVLIPVYERVFIHDSYATRPEKGTHRAILRARSFVRRWPWYLKADVKKYFDSVDHEILMDILKRKLKDGRVLDLLERIVDNTPTPGKGLPIGNLTSQFLANVYLDPLDHEIKDRRRIRGYIRYMDDLIVFGDSKTELLSQKMFIEQYLEEKLDLRLKPGGTYVNRSKHGLSFLGVRIFERIIRVRPENLRRSLRRMHRRIREWRCGRLDEDSMVQSVESIVGHLRYFCPKINVV